MCDRQRRVARQHLLEKFSCLVRPAQASEDFAQPNSRFEVCRIDLGRAPEVLFRSCEVVSLRQDQRQVEMGLPVVVVELDRSSHLLFGLSLVAELNQDHAEVEQGNRVVWQGLVRGLEGDQRLLKVAPPHGVGAALEVGLPTYVESLQGGEQRIREGDPHMLILLQLIRRLFAAAQAPKHEPYVVVDYGPLGLSSEGGLEALDRTLHVAPFEVDATEAEMGCRVALVEVQDAAILGLRVVEAAEVEQGVGSPDSGGEVPRREGEHPVEGCDGQLEVALEDVVNREEVRPAGISRIEQLGVAKGGRRGRHEVVQQVELAEVAVRARKLGPIRVRSSELLVESRLRRRQLILHRLLVVVHPRTLDRLQGRLRVARGRRESQRDSQSAAQKRCPTRFGVQGAGLASRAAALPLPRTRVK